MRLEPRRFSLKFKIAAIVLLVSITSVWLLTFAFLGHLKRDLRTAFEKQQQSTVSYIAADIDAELQLRISQLEKNNRLIAQHRHAPRSLHAFLQTRTGLHAHFKGGLRVLDRQAKLVATYPRQAGPRTLSSTDTDAVREALSSGRTVIGAPRVSTLARQAVVPVATPVHASSGERVGVLVGLATLSDQNLFKHVEHIDLLNTGELLIFSPEHAQVLASNEPSYRLKPLEKNGLQAATPGIAGEAKALIVAETIPTAGWRVQLTTPEEKVFAPLQQTMNRVYGTAGVLTLLTILALWFAIQNALTPLEKVSALIHQMASGKGGLHRLPLFGDKEIKRLLESFNKLIAQRHHYEQTIRVNEARLTRAELAANMGHWELHLGNKMIFGSQGAIKIYGLDNEALGLEAIQGMTLPEYRPSLDAAMAALLESGAPYDVEYKMRLPHTGEIKAIHSQAFFDKEKQIVFGILQDITKPKRYEEQLRESEAHYRLLAENSQDVIWTLDFATQRFTYVSPSVVKMRGYTAEEVMQQTLAESLTPEALATANDAIANLLAGLKTGDRDNLSATMEIEQPHRDGHLVPTEVVASCVLDELGYPKTIVGITRDITERKKAQAMLEHMAHSDPLTGLPNRRHFISLAKQELARTLRYGGKLSMLMMDIDHFKSINDAYGHATGDWVLRRIGAVCRDVLREIDVTARIGGEEFAIMLPQTDEARAVAAAERLRETIATISGAPQTNHTLTLSVSIGVATLSAATGDLDTLLFLADKALYKAKHAGRNRVWAHDDQTA